MTPTDADSLLVRMHLREPAFIDTISASELLQLSRDDARGALDRMAQPRVGILGESQTARVEVSRYLKDWSGPEGFLTREGNPPKVVYRPRGIVADLGDSGELS